MKSNISKKQSKELSKTLKEAQQALKNIEGITEMIQDVTSMAKQGIDTEELENLTKDGAPEAALNNLKAEDLESLLKELQTLFPSIQDAVKKQQEEQQAVKKS
jgi:hypothetical protein